MPGLAKYFGKSDLDSTAKEVNASADNVSDVVKGTRYAAKAQRAAKQGLRRYSRSSKTITDLATDKIKEIFKFLKDNPIAFSRSVDDAGDAGKSVKKPPGQVPDPTRGATDIATETLRRQRIEAIVGTITNTKVLGVAGFSGMLLYAGIITDNTDNVTATIKTLKIDDNDNTFAIITYTNPSAAGLFIPAEGDTITLSTSTGLSSGNDFEIVDIPGDDMIKINIASIPSASRPLKGTVITPSPSNTPMTFTCHSDFGNQLSGAIDDLVGGVLGAVATAANIAIDEAGNIILNAADLAGSLVAKAADVGTDVAGQAFCKILPFLCNWTIWIILIALIAGGIILTVILNKKK